MGSGFDALLDKEKEMNDGMKMGDGLAIRLACGHPNKKAGELCENCGEVVPTQESENEPRSVQTGDGSTGHD